MRTLVVQLMLLSTSLIYFALNSPDVGYGDFHDQDLRIHATGVDFYFHSGLAPQSFRATKGIGLMKVMGLASIQA